MPDAIDIAHVSRTFGGGAARIQAIADVSLSVRQGELVSIVGESGCGKTTLLRMLAGLLRPTAGAIRVNGREVEGPLPDIGFVFQRPVLLHWRRVLENVLLPIEIARRDPTAHRPEAERLLVLLGLAGFERHYPRQLSGGMQQRVSIARTLMNDPQVLLMDEPFGALDAITRERLDLELLNLWSQRRVTCVFVTHDISEAVFLSDRIYLMSPRPGRVERIFEVDLPRPRSADLRFEARFNALAREIRHAMHGAGGAAA